jgi:UDP-N-acetyl-D-galactosamine dehydrogenase
VSASLAAAETPRFAVIGLGYVGLPLAVAFGRHWPTLGFDIDADRIAELRDGQDHTLEVEADELASARQLQYGSDPALLDACNVYIVTVPTPIDAYEQPDLEPLRSATRLIASHLRAGDLVIYESTVYPGTTEEVCVPLLEKARACASTKTSTAATARSGSVPVTASGAWPTSARSPRVRQRKWLR